MNLIMLVKFVQFNHLLKVSLAAGLEEAGEMTKTAAKEKASIAQANLQEAVRILRVEPDALAHGVTETPGRLSRVFLRLLGSKLPPSGGLRSFFPASNAPNGGKREGAKRKSHYSAR